MTLSVLVLSREAVLLSGDFRLSYPDGRFLDDLSVQKLLPVAKFGWNALISFSGVATLPNRRPTGSWIADQLKPEVMREKPDALVGRLRRADEWLSKLSGETRLSIVVAGYHGRQPFGRLLSNFQDGRGHPFAKTEPMLRSFALPAKHFSVQAFGGTRQMGADKLRDLEISLKGTKLANAHETIAAFNVQSRDQNLRGTISRECVVGAILPTGLRTLLPFGIDPSHEYLPSHVLSDRSVLGSCTVIPRKDEHGKPMVPAWRGTQFRTDGAPNAARMVILHQFRNVERIEYSNDDRLPVPYNVDPVSSYIAEGDGKAGISKDFEAIVRDVSGRKIIAKVPKHVEGTSKESP